MLVRILTGLVGAPVVLFILISGTTAMQIIGTAVGIIAMMEYFKAVSTTYKPMQILGIGAIAVYFIFYRFIIDYYHIYISILLILTLTINVIKYPKYTLNDITITFFGVIYVGLLLGLIISIREMISGLFWVVLIFVCAWGSDTCAYFIGKFFGAKKLTPILSPKKTIAGAIGGIIGASIMVWIYCYIMIHLEQIVLSTSQIIVLVIVGGICALLSQIGDLAASSIKRAVNVKDYGRMFPGHGGVLDRIDSVLLITPLVYIVAYIFTN
ncbi:MAG: hypothetical protein BEN19_02460 [Epulopiscium sp. Nuni2H_MBin003]|nr:MAG: hypothetical protein BEN19_02460 [Epulopiscium sp. Nuni2H_MBin003]